MADQSPSKCWNCGKLNHTTADCPSTEPLCFNCQQPGHKSPACPKPRGILNRQCFKCHEKGHLTKDCTNRSKWACTNCAENGHGHWECPKPRGILNRECNKCHEKGHLLKDCTNRSKWVCTNCTGNGHEYRECPKPRGILNRKCGGCGEKGHQSIECTNRAKWNCSNCDGAGHGHWECSKPRGYKTMKCHRCDEIGHLAKECMNKSKWICTKCKGSGHGHWECPSRTCVSCGLFGHTWKTCTDQPVRCHICGSVDHRTTACPWSPDSAGDPLGYPSPPNTDSNKNPSPEQDVPNFTFQGKSDNSNVNTSSTRTATKLDEKFKYKAKSSAPNLSDHTSDSKPKNTNTDPREDAISWNTSALAAFRANDHDNALSLFSKAIALDPTIPTFYTNRAVTHMKLGDHITALRDFTSASSIPTYAPTARQLVHIARCRFLLGSSSAALHAVRDALALQPANMDAVILKGRVMELEGHMGDYRAAKARGHWRMAKIAHEGCVRVYAKENSDAPVEVECWGITLLLVERDWEAVEIATSIAVCTFSKETEVLVLRALVLFLTANISGALTQLVEVLKLDPDSQRAKALRARVKEIDRLKSEGNVMFRDCDWKDAIEKWSAALLLVGENEEEGGGGLIRATLLLNKGTALTKLERYAEALQDIDASLKYKPNYFKALRTRARIYVGLELFDSAVENFTAAIECGSALMTDEELILLKEEMEGTEKKALAHREKEKDYYKILGLTKNCTASEIRKAYRSESLKHHPDKGGIAEMFKLVAEAYHILSDQVERLRYDAKCSSQRNFWDY